MNMNMSAHGNEFQRLPALALALFACLAAATATAQNTPRFTRVERQTNGEILLHLEAPGGMHYRIDSSSNLPDWSSLSTLLGTGTDELIDSAAPYISQRFYRAEPVASMGVLTGDHLATREGEVIIHPVDHASFVMSWNGKMIYNDAVGAPSLYADMPKADLVLVGHTHGDHFSSSTIETVLGPEGVIIAPQAVYNSLPMRLRPFATSP